MHKFKLEEYRGNIKCHRLSSWLYLCYGIGICAILLAIYAKINDCKYEFKNTAHLLAEEVDRKLAANESVLSGFAAFLQAVDKEDKYSACRYANAALLPYKHIYMIEVAKKVKRSNQDDFVKAMRKGWRNDFKLRNFAEVTKTDRVNPSSNYIWPIIFMYPYLPIADSIYGVNLDTVPHLSPALNRAYISNHPIATPPFQLMEGGSAYILLQKVERPENKNSALELNFFGNDMVVMLLVKTNKLLPDIVDRYVGISATIFDDATSTSHIIFNHPAKIKSWFDGLFLPHFTGSIISSSSSQPVRINFEHQLSWAELLDINLLVVIGLILSTTYFILRNIRRHYQNLTLVTERHEQAEYLAMHDELTGLANRHLLVDHVQQTINRWRRNGVLAALIVIDLDNFKEINDRLGHDAGDAVLVETAKRIKALVRSTDTVARYGGDEFIIVINDILSVEDVAAIAEKTLKNISEPIFCGKEKLEITCSLGIAICPQNGQDYDALRYAADKAMYKAKESGRNAFRVSN
ncbi:sensor domain-containing diguanylate cyclase [Oryzomonas rubra]|nr:sensor domain-containing diguanylate cyclase [Oryzomonas rubra]